MPSRIVYIACSDEWYCGYGAHTGQSQNQVGLLQYMAQRDSGGNARHHRGLVEGAHCSHVVNLAYVYLHIQITPAHVVHV